MIGAGVGLYIKFFDKAWVNKDINDKNEYKIEKLYLVLMYLLWSCGSFDVINGR